MHSLPTLTEMRCQLLDQHRKKTEFTANLETAAWNMMKYLYHLLSDLGQLLWELSEANVRHKLMVN